MFNNNSTARKVRQVLFKLVTGFKHCVTLQVPIIYITLKFLFQYEKPLPVHLDRLHYGTTNTVVNVVTIFKYQNE